MNRNYNVWVAILYVIVMTVTIIFALDLFAAPTCDEVLNSCEEAVTAQESTIKTCQEVSAQKDHLVATLKENVAATEKNLETQETLSKISLGAALITLLKVLIFL